MKRLFALMCALLLMTVVLVGCVGAGEDETSSEPEPIVYKQNPFTGEEQEEDYPYCQRPVAVMVNNIMSADSYQSAWPQSGLSDADIIFEMETEGGITRYMAIFRDYTKMPVVGPIRSARDQFVQNMMPLGCFYVHDGGSTYAKALLADYGWDNRDLNPNRGISYRTGNTAKAYEHTEYTSGELIQKTVESGKYDLSVEFEPNNMFNWVLYDQEPRVLNGTDVTEISWSFSKSYGAVMTFNPETGKYTKVHWNLGSNFSHPMVDANKNNAPVEFDNVFILWTTIERYPDGILSKVDFSWGGVGYYFNGGKVEKVRWLKGTAMEPLKIVSNDGYETEIEVNIGKTYIAFVSLDYFGKFEMDGVPVDAYGDYTEPEGEEIIEGVEAEDASEQSAEEKK